MNMQDAGAPVTLDAIREALSSPALDRVCETMRSAYRAQVKCEFSACTMAYGWNVKFRKAGKTLCTVYPHEDSFDLMVVVGQKEKPLAEGLLGECCAELRALYESTREGNGQRWLMATIREDGALLDDMLRLIEFRRMTK